VPHLMRSATMHAGAVENSVERFANVRFIERRSRHGREHPLGKRTADGEPGRALLPAPEPQRRRQLVRQIDAPALMILRRGQDATHHVPLHLDEAAAPV